MNNRFSHLFKKKEPTPKKKKVSMRYLLLIVSLGVALMLIDSLFSSGKEQQTVPVSVANEEAETEPTKEDSQSALGQNESSPSSVIEYQDYYADQLKEALEDMYGVTDVTVKVYVDTSKKKIVEKNRNTQSETTDETDRQGGDRRIEQHSDDSETVIINDADGDEPLIIGTEAPKISGVVVVAGGADHAQVKLWIQGAVNSLYGVPENRIYVVPKKGKGNED